MPWYATLERLLAPTDTVATMALLLIVGITVALILYGNRISRAAWLVYLVSP